MAALQPTSPRMEVAQAHGAMASTSMEAGAHQSEPPDGATQSDLWHDPACLYKLARPKSVTELWASASPVVRQQIEAALDAAAFAALRYLAENAIYSRRTKGGAELVPIERVGRCSTNVSSQTCQEDLTC